MKNKDNKISRAYKIKRYHTDEVKMVLFICATDLNGYHVDDLKIFAECISSRIEVLFTTEYLTSINDFINVNDSSINKLLNLKIKLQQQYIGQWYRKMITSSWNKEVFELSHEILKLLQIEYQEPLTFMENHFEVDWD